MSHIYQQWHSITKNSNDVASQIIFINKLSGLQLDIFTLFWVGLQLARHSHPFGVSRWHFLKLMETWIQKLDLMLCLLLNLLLFYFKVAYRFFHQGIATAVAIWSWHLAGVLRHGVWILAPLSTFDIGYQTNKNFQPELKWTFND